MYIAMNSRGVKRAPMLRVPSISQRYQGSGLPTMLPTITPIAANVSTGMSALRIILQPFDARLRDYPPSEISPRIFVIAAAIRGSSFSRADQTRSTSISK